MHAALVQIIWLFYCVPVIFGWGLDAWQSAILALSLNLIAFNAEAFRASIQAIPLAHHDASVALGLSAYQRIGYVVFPQAFRMAMPVLITNAVGTFQQSALVSIITIPDLMYNGRMLATETFRPIETFTTVAILYFLVTLPLTQVAKVVEDRVASKMGIR